MNYELFDDLFNKVLFLEERTKKLHRELSLLEATVVDSADSFDFVDFDEFSFNSRVHFYEN